MAPLIVLAAVLTIALVLLLAFWPRTEAGPESTCGYCGGPLAECERAEECETCERRCVTNMTLTAEKKRDAGNGLVGGSSISATFCAQHHPASV